MRVVWSFLYFFSVLALAGPVLVKEQKKVADPLIVPYQQYRLDNGLTVILTQDHSDPLVHVAVHYRVGLPEEAPGQSGLAHLFEHMMFQGSAHVGEEGYIRLLQQVGGRNINGLTSRDQTRYYQTLPANQLEKVLWLEADRMGFLLDAVCQKKFEIQRATVKNERAQRIDNQPYGLVSEKVGEALYPRTHPYSWQPIGYVEDLDRVDVNDLKQFFLRWYGPNNATLTLGGDFDTKQALAWIEQYFGSIPRGPDVAEPTPAPVTLPETRYVTLEDKVHLPLLYISYPTVSLGDAQEPALDMFADVLGGSASSMLYQSLVKSGKAIDAGASHYCEELACTLTVYAYPNPAVDGSLKTLKSEVDKVIGEFAGRGLKPEDLEKAINSYRASAIWGLDSVSGKVSQLAMGQVFAQDPNYVFKSLDAIGKVTPEQVKTAYDKFILNKPAVVLSVVPKGKSDWQAAKPNFTPAKRELPDYSKHDQVLAERPVIVFGKWREHAGTTPPNLIVEGRAAHGPYTQTLPIDVAANGPGTGALRLLWARHRIAAPSDEEALTGGDAQKAAITKLGLDYSLLTQYTSFIAVDQVVRNPGGQGATANQPSPLPEGVSNLAVGEASALGAAVSSTPEPETWAAMLVVLAVLGAQMARRQRRQPFTA